MSIRLFVNPDALDIDLSLGTVFYFYNPLSSTEETDAVGILAGRLTELGGRKRIQIAVRGESMRELLRASGVFTWHTVLEYPGVWTVFKSPGDASM
ncbi:hypothetical protein [Nocardia sp. NBC_01377]|uniref:hypothetical protein n=1 Tax=Nocardia sp. NBC_01377 TaxID=2903595 RepID=UPI00386439D7